MRMSRVLSRSSPVWKLLLLASILGGVGMAAGSESGIGDQPAIRQHIRHEDILAGRLSFEQIFQAGGELFATEFNRLDGAGRPETTGTGEFARVRREGVEAFNRLSGPDSNACFGCHNKPRSGGGGENAVNVFVLAQRFGFVDDFNEVDPIIQPPQSPGTLKTVGVERNSIGMFGAAAIELLAREMTAEMHAIRQQALERAQQTGNPATLRLRTKGVDFGRITGNPDGSVDTSGVEGVDPDLIIKPFHAKGVVTSMRQFASNATNHHHGMQAVERFGLNTDPDKDGVVNEVTVGDITAISVFMAGLAFPGQRIPRDPARAAAVENGERLFVRAGCADCHRPVLELNSPIYSEPNPFNPPGNLRPGDFPTGYSFDLTRNGELPRPRLERDGKILVRAFTDLKRHDLGNDPRINNETLLQGGVPTSVFITKKLWGFNSESPFLHNGRATLIGDAIDAHGGEAQRSRDAYTSLSAYDRASIVEYLKTLVVLPPGTRDLVVYE